MGDSTHFEIVIEHDDDHALHVQSDALEGLYDDQDDMPAYELDRLESGEWTAYGVTVARVCDCCDSVTEQHVTALWGVVVEQDNAAGRYARTKDIDDEYLKDVARDVLAEATS